MNKTGFILVSTETGEDGKVEAPIEVIESFHRFNVLTNKLLEMMKQELGEEWIDEELND